MKANQITRNIQNTGIPCQKKARKCISILGYPAGILKYLVNVLNRILFVM